MATETAVQLDRERVRSMIEREAARLDERTRGSAEMYERARRSLSGGVASSYQARDPWPIYLDRGEGPVVHDVDGNRMWDFHNGFGSMVQGHAHPAIVRAVRERVARGDALRRDDRGRRARRRGAAAALGPRALALLELGLRGDDGRDPDRARLHRAR